MEPVKLKIETDTRSLDDLESQLERIVDMINHVEEGLKRLGANSPLGSGYQTTC